MATNLQYQYCENLHTISHITQEVEHKITEISLMRINNGGKDVHWSGNHRSKRLNKGSVPVYFWQIWGYFGLTIAVQISISFNNGLQYILLVAKQIFVQLIDNMMINNRVLEDLLMDRWMVSLVSLELDILLYSKHPELHLGNKSLTISNFSFIDRTPDSSTQHHRRTECAQLISNITKL